MNRAQNVIHGDLFNFLNDLNNLNINGKKITTEQKKEIVEKFINEKGEISPENYVPIWKLICVGIRVSGKTMRRRY